MSLHQYLRELRFRLQQLPPYLSDTWSSTQPAATNNENDTHHTYHPQGSEETSINVSFVPLKSSPQAIKTIILNNTLSEDHYKPQPCCLTSLEMWCIIGRCEELEKKPTADHNKLETQNTPALPPQSETASPFTHVIFVFPRYYPTRDISAPCVHSPGLWLYLHCTWGPDWRSGPHNLNLPKTRIYVIALGGLNVGAYRGAPPQYLPPW